MFVCLILAFGVVFSALAGQNSDRPTASDASWTKEYRQTSLHSPQLKVTLYEPDAQHGYYRGTRFDWSGLISRVDYSGHTFFSQFKQEHDPLNHDDICGTAEEFGIESAPSYATAKPGEPFIKIGIGVLEKPDDSPYEFWKRYTIRTPGLWHETHSARKIKYRQKLQGPNGWSYDYTKIIELAPNAPELKIIRRLKNTGSQDIQTDQYCHNFLRIDDTPAGTNYTLEFRFAPTFGKDSQTQGCMEIQNRSLLFTKNPPPEKGIWLRLEGFSQREDNSIRIVNHSTGAAMTMTTDQPLSKFVFYSSGGVLSPEAFVKVSIPPGHTQEWTTTYRFEARTPTGASN